MNNLPGDAIKDKRDAVAPIEAANEARIEGGGRPFAWDPFEVWRTRVRDVRDERARQKTTPAED